MAEVYGVEVCKRCDGCGKICQYCGQNQIETHTRKCRKGGFRRHLWGKCPACDGAGMRPRRLDAGASGGTPERCSAAGLPCGSSLAVEGI